VKVNVQRRAKRCSSVTAPVATVARVSPARNRKPETLRYATPRERGRVRRQQEPQRVRQRQHPLAQRPLGQHLIDQQRRSLGHAPSTARGAEPASLATERDELLGVALVTA
jgi:hypothetical protein